MKKRGLTLVEMLATIAIISILFIILTPQVENAIEQTKLAGVQSDLKNYETGIKMYMLKGSSSEDVDGLNQYLDKKIKFYLEGDKYISKNKENPYKNNYELTTDWRTFFQVNSYTDEKNPRIHSILINKDEEGIESTLMGFDKEKRKDDLDAEKPVISVTPNGGVDIEKVTVSTIDNKETITIEYKWSKDSKQPSDGWETTTNGSDLYTNTLGDGKYYLHIKAKDNKNNVSTFTSDVYSLGDVIPPTISVSPNGSTEEKTRHNVTVTITDNKAVKEAKYAWSKSTNKPSSGWSTITNGATVSTTSEIGTQYLHITATDLAGNGINFVSDGFIVKNRETPTISLSENGNNELKTIHKTTIHVTNDEEIQSIKYAWSNSTSKPSNGWYTISNNSEVSSNIEGPNVYLHVEVKEENGNVINFVSNVFNTLEKTPPNITLSKNGDLTKALTHTTTINATDNARVEKIEYVWTESSVAPTTGWTIINSGTNVSSPETNESVYLFVKATDNHGNSATFRSELFVQSIYEYTTDRNGVIIQNYLGSNRNVTIPSALNGTKVIGLANSSFKSKNLTSVIVPNGVTSIGNNAFQDNQLATVTFSNDIASIGNYAFASNQLTTIKIPSSVSSIGTYAFYDNPNLKTVSNCSPLSVGSYFNSSPTVNRSGCPITDSNEDGWDDILGLPVYTTPNVDESVFNTSDNEDGTITITGYKGQVTDLIIPNTIKNKKVTVLGDYAFAPSGTVSGGKNTGVTLTSVIIPNGVKSIGHSTFRSNKLTSVTMPDSVTEIIAYAFYANQLESFTIPKGVAFIGDSTFSNNILSYIYIPHNVKTIDYSAFRNNQLTSVSISSGVTTIGNAVFYENRILRTIKNCSSLTLASNNHYNPGATVTKEGC